jgi:signal transduction histidine kinase
MSLVAAAPLAGSGWWAMRTARQSALEASRAALTREAAAHSDLVARWADDQLAALEGWTRLYPTTLRGLPPELQLGLLRAVFRAVPGTEVVVLVDGAGQLVVPAVTRDEEGEGRAAELMTRLPSAVAAQRGASLGVPWLHGEGVPTVPLAARATADEGPPWVLGAEVQLQVAADLSARAGRDHAVVLLDGSGAPLVGGHHPLVEPSLLRPLVGDFTADFVYTTAAGVSVRGAAAPVAGTDWTVAVVAPTTVTEAGAVAIERRLGAAVAVAAAVATALAVFIARSLSQPIAALRDAAIDVSRGQLERRVHSAARDEVGELARAFDEMTAQLSADAAEIAAQRSEIERFNEQLQARVEQRTRALRVAQDALVRSGQRAAVAEVSAGLAHELNNPLASMLGTLQLLAARAADPTVRATLQALEGEAQRCREVLSTMGQLSEDGPGLSVSTPVDLRGVVHDAVHLVAGLFRGRGIALRWTAPADPVFARVDPAAASRALTLVLHALRAGLGDGAAVTVTLGRQAADGRPEIVCAPDRALGAGHTWDDARAAGMTRWVARRSVERIGGALLAPESGGVYGDDATADAGDPDGASLDAPWRMVLPDP